MSAAWRNGVREQAGVGDEAVLHLVLVGEAVFEVGDGREAVEDPRELGDGGHVGLHEERRVRRVEAEGEVVEGHVERVAAQRLGVAQAGERVVVDDEEERRVAVHATVLVDLLRALHVLAQRAEVVAEVERAGGLDAGDDDRGGHTKAMASMVNDQWQTGKGRPAARGRKAEAPTISK